MGPFRDGWELLALVIGVVVLLLVVTVLLAEHYLGG